MYYQYEILELIKELNKENGITIVMVLHDINQAIRYSNTIIAMKDGRVVEHGDPQDIITEKLMKDVYGIDVEIIKNHETGLHIIPIGI
jgi:iron complex transport system ATP-binding protein